MAENDLLTKLLKIRIIPLGEIVGESVDRIKRDMAALAFESDDPVVLLIDSPGGKVINGFSLIDFIGMIDVKVIGVVNGSCNSMAVPVLQACSKRLATQHSTFFLHPIATEKKYWNDDDFTQVVQDDKRRFESLHQYYLNLLMKRSTKSREELDRTIKLGQKYGGLIFAQEAVEWGLIDNILPEDFKLFRYEKVTVNRIQFNPIKID